MSSPSVSAAPSNVNRAFSVGQRVTARTGDLFDSKPGTVAMVVHGNQPSYYDSLDDQAFSRDWLFFGPEELEAVA